MDTQFELALLFPRLVLNDEEMESRCTAHVNILFPLGLLLC